MTDKEQIIIDGVDVSECNFAILPKDSCPAKSRPYARETCCIACKEHNTILNYCKNNPNCYFKQLAHKTQLIDEVEEVIKPYQEQIELDALSLPIAIESILERKEQECEELKIQLMQKDEVNTFVNTFFNAPLEGWSSDPCGICESKNNYEQLKQEYENLKAEEKFLKQCCTKAGEELAKHSFDYDGKEKNLVVQAMELNEKYEKFENALEEIEQELKEDIYCESQECGCDDYEECLRCTKNIILDIVNKAKEEA